MIKKYFDCGCGSEVLKISVETEEYTDVTSTRTLLREFYFTIFNQYTSTWETRWRNIWHILRYGEPHADQIIFNIDEVEEIAKFLNDIIKQSRNGKGS